MIGKNRHHAFQSSFSQFLLSTAPPLPPSGLLKREALRLGEGTERKELLRTLLCASEISIIIIVEKTESSEGQMTNPKVSGMVIWGAKIQNQVCLTPTVVSLIVINSDSCLCQEY